MPQICQEARCGPTSTPYSDDPDCLPILQRCEIWQSYSSIGKAGPEVQQAEAVCQHEVSILERPR